MLPSGGPPVWRNDLRQTTVPSSQDAYTSQSGGSPEGLASYAPSSCSEGYRHVRQVCSLQPSVDLYDLLLNTKNEETYQPYFQGWPALLKPVSPETCDLPLRVQEKYLKCQTMCFCGVFPSVQLAWASIDNSLYLWRYDRRGDVPVEYCGEEQAICAVGLVKPRPGVFLEAIEHVIVLCTTTEIVLLGLCLGSGASSTLPSIALQPLPMYSVSSDNVVMTCVAGSSMGRIFLGGSDGHLYELHYAATESWVQKRINKVRLTGKLQQLLPSFIPAMLGYTKSATERVVVDDERHILYCLNTPGYIQVFDLGVKGTDTAHKVAEIRDVGQAAAQTSSGRDVFRNVSRDAESAAIKYLAPISPAESTKLHLLAITSDGRRVYLTTQPLRSSTYTRDPAARPVLLQPVFSRHAPPDAGMTLPRSQADWGRPAAGQRIMCMHASKACLLMAGPGGAFGQSTKLLLTAQNPTLPLASALTSAGAGTPAVGLRELLFEMDNVLEGETVCIESLPRQGLLDSLSHQIRSPDELVAQLFAPPPRFVMMSTAGVIQMEKRRPLEVLSSLLEERKEQLTVQFFEAFGPVESATMCLALACAPRTTTSSSVAEAARACFEDPALVGEAKMPQSVANGGAGSGMAPPALGAGIYMGQAVNPNPEPDWSAAYRGICLYVSRLLSPVWEAPVARPSQQAQGEAASVLVQVYLPRQAMEDVEAKLRSLDSFLRSYLTRRQQQGSLARYRAATSPLDPAAAGLALGGGFGVQRLPGQQDDDRLLKRQRLVPASQMEDEKTRRVQVLVDKAAQALALIRLLLANNLARIAATLSPEARKQLTQLTVRDLVCEVSGEQLAAQLISVLVTQQIDNASTAPGSVVTSVGAVAKLLSRHCPAFFKEDDKMYYQACAQLRAAMLVAPGTERDAITQSALDVLLRVPLSAALDLVTSQLAFLGAFKGMVDVALAAGIAVDLAGAALRPDGSTDGQKAAARRRDKYKPVLSVLRQYTTNSGNPTTTAVTEACLPADKVLPTVPARPAAQAALLKACFAAKDAFFHACLYDALIDMQESATLLAANPPHLQEYLLEKSGLKEALVAAVSGQPPSPVGPLSGQEYGLGHLLAQLFVKQGQFAQAAGVYMSLAGRKSGPGEQAVPITERVKCLQSAVLQARSLGDSRLVDKVEADARLMKLQAVLVKRVQGVRGKAAGSDSAADLGRMEDELTAAPLDVTQLYNDFAQPLKLWDVCLQLVDFAANKVEGSIVKQLWDLALSAAVQDAPQGDTLESAAALVEELGAQFYPRDSYPMEHVASRLLQISLRSWPPGAAPDSSADLTALQGTSEQRVVRTLLATCAASLPTVMRTLELLLVQRGDMPELGSNALRLMLLKCLLEACTAELKELRSATVTPGLVPLTSKPAATQMDVAAQRKASLLYDACARFELEAGKMSMPEARGLSESFNKMRGSLRSYSRGTLLDVV